ncbi:MAG: lyase family protein [Bacteroidia bacterium]
MEFRKEKDTMGIVEVPANAYWGAQTERSVENFKIARETNKMPREIIEAFAYLKKAAALTNFDAGVLPKEKMRSYLQSIDEILEGKWMDQFPLVCETGSGTQMV